MYEELIHELFMLSEEPHDTYYAAAAALETQSAQLAERDAEIERTGGYVAIPKWQYDVMRADLARVTAERDAAVKMADEMCEEIENCYGRETDLTQQWRTPEKQDEEG